MEKLKGVVLRVKRARLLPLLAIYGVDRMLEGFGRGIFLLFYVTTGHADMSAQTAAHAIKGLPPACLMWGD